MEKAEKDINYKKLAKIISFVSTHAIVGTLTLVYVLYKLSPSLDSFYKSFAVVLLFSIIIPIIFVFYLMKKKKIGNFHVKERKERALPFAFALISSAISLVVIKYIGESLQLTRLFMTLYLMGLGYVAINIMKFKISGHTFVFTSAIIVLTAFFDLKFIFLLPFVIVIGWARVYLKEHTIGEVVGGFAYAIVSFIIFSLLIHN